MNNSFNANTKKESQMKTKIKKSKKPVKLTLDQLENNLEQAKVWAIQNMVALEYLLKFYPDDKVSINNKNADLSVWNNQVKKIEAQILANPINSLFK